MSDSKKKIQDGLSDIDALFDLMDNDETIDDIDNDEELDDFEETVLDDDSDTAESPIKLFCAGIADKAKALSGKAKDMCDDISDISYRTYTEPAEKTLVKSKTSLITILSCSAAFIALAVAAYFFLTSFNYYTTGVTVSEFIERFNSFEVTSQSDIYEIIPSYTDVVIPDDAKLGGNRTIELMDGHVVIEADTRFGKIVKLTVKNVDYPGYDKRIHYFNTTDGNTDYLYYYVCLGKALSAFQPEASTLYETTLSAYQMHQYAFVYMLYGQGGVYTIEVDGNNLSYHLTDACITVEPVKKTITSAVWPEWLQPKEKVEDAVIDDTTSSGDVTSDSSVASSTDAQ